jgi:hypothetical protein
VTAALLCLLPPPPPPQIIELGAGRLCARLVVVCFGQRRTRRSTRPPSTQRYLCSVLCCCFQGAPEASTPGALYSIALPLLAATYLGWLIDHGDERDRRERKKLLGLRQLG